MVVVDSGVNPDNPHIGEIAGGVGIGPTGRERPDFSDRLGHGTAVVAAIQEKAPEAEILVVKVFEGELATSLPGLRAALEWAVAERADLVNLSLGTPKPEHEGLLQSTVQEAIAAGVLIVSPREHRGHRWWPGAFSGVAGVLLDWECRREELRLMDDPHGRPVFRASGFPRPVPGIPREHNIRGISFAAANATGILARVRERAEPTQGIEKWCARIREGRAEAG